MMMKSTLLITTMMFMHLYPAGLRIQEPEPLYKKYSSYFPIGAAINPAVDLATQERKDFIRSQYNSVTPENQMKMKQIHPREHVWNWEPADKIVRFARENHMKVRGHALVWYQNMPEWMLNHNGKPVTRDILFQKIREHIRGMIGRYGAHVYCWDVVNEAISDSPKEVYRPKDSLYAIAGEDYVEMAFRFAREADPGAKLFYNDYRFSDPIKRKKIYDLLKRLLEKGTPIDGVGMQSHYTPGEVTREYLQETIDMFSGLGLKIQVTELDVSVYNYRDKKSMDADKTDEKYTPERAARQEAMYRMLFEVYRANKEKISGVTFWGTSDMRNNFRQNRIGKMDYPFVFDENMEPKKVYYTITQF